MTADVPVPAELEVLFGPDGPSALAAAVALDPADGLAAATALRRRFAPALVSAALSQAALRRSAVSKFGDDAATMLFTRAGLEQASGSAVAAHRFARLAGARGVADLCCGIGGDLVALCRAGHEVLAVDRDPVHLRLAATNAAAVVPTATVHTLCADVRDADLDGVDAVFVDPARRDDAGGRRDVDGEPSLAWCAGLADRVPAVVVKSSPAVPDTLVPDGWEAEFVADGRELKEATLWSPSLAEVSRRATVLADDGTHTLAACAGPAVPVDEPAAYLLDPNPAVTRAGLVETLAALIGASKIDERIAFLTTAAPVSTPFARVMPVLASLPWSERAVTAELRRLGAGSVEVRRRGLGGDVDALTMRLRRRLPSAGSVRVLVAMTRHRDRPWAILCAA